jgi:solute carrier family 6 amino acid transporter-like protein 5/7/9/14
MDSIPSLRKHKSVIIGVLCTVMFLLGLPLCTQGGQYWIELMDKHSGGWALLLIGAIECIAVGWVYGKSYSFNDFSLLK